MTIHQLSIFMENKSGALIKVLGLLRRFGIQIIASTIADTAENGLRKAGIAVALSDVFALELDDQPGRAADAIEILSDAGIGISYMYTFLLRGKGILVFRTDAPEKAKETIILNQMKFIAEKDLSVWA